MGGFILFLLIQLSKWAVDNIMIFVIFAMIFVSWIFGVMARDAFNTFKK